MHNIPDLAIIIVNWNSAPLLRHCLASIYRNTVGLTFEVIVVDNNSNDGCRQVIDDEYPEVLFVQCHQNVGFAKANNLGYQRSRARLLLFLNPDTEVIGSALSQMVRFIDSTTNAGVIGAQLLNTDHSLQTSCMQPFPTILNQFVDAELLRQMCPRLFIWGTSAMVKDPVQVLAAEVISGACLMLRRGVFEKVQLFDEDYFMYAEDADLCFKVKQAGWVNYYFGHAIVIHHGGKSSATAFHNCFSAIVMRDSLYKFFRKHGGSPYAGAYRVTTAMIAGLRLVLLTVARLLLGGFWSSAQTNAIRKWAKVLRWSIGMESWVNELLTNN